MGKNNRSGLEALHSVQFVTANGKRLAVMDADDWEALVEWLETFEDRQIVREATEDLKAGGGSRERAGWEQWKTAAGEIQ
ncbi:MAG: hypothetical protein HUU20_13755 [Pirellulales bacterium]|nr:hypothetical protein [Pirellulales bacterium]